MKANELEIGDLVYNHRNWECPIVEIHKNSAVVIARHYGEEEFLLSDLRPIPLTPEILEKNGWIKTKYAYGRDCMEIHGTDELPKGVDNALSMARWSIEKNFQYHFLDLYMWKGSITQHNVHYVHQLQHAFKIFGIEKEIIL